MKRRKIKVHITDAAFVCRTGTVLKNVDFFRYGSTYGRFIFAEIAPIVSAQGDGITIKGCSFVSR